MKFGMKIDYKFSNRFLYEVRTLSYNFTEPLKLFSKIIHRYVPKKSPLQNGNNNAAATTTSTATTATASINMLLFLLLLLMTIIICN